MLFVRTGASMYVCLPTKNVHNKLQVILPMENYGKME